MPILTLQHRFMELGRLRMGDRKGTNKAPRKLAHWRLTSASRPLLDEAGKLYGGEPQRWLDAPSEGFFELYTETAVIDIVIPPVFSQADGEPTYPYSQWFERWSGGGRERQCDGKTEVTTGKPCLCLAD